MPAAERLNEYLPMLQGKRVALLINQTSRVGNTLLADTLQKRGVNLVRLFVPEHGFRGTADAGADVSGGKDAATGLPIVSLYGDQKKPTAAQLSDVDILVYDLQDVGVRFYTYISTLQYAMEACAENGRQLIILDRPNPNGYYVDGPVLEHENRSFVGMQAIPVVYGMTPGEYAQMLTGERWYTGAARLSLQVVPCSGYTHSAHYSLPVAPSPNLRTDAAIALYPSLCFFEGTVISVGRGTDKPFQQWGHPSFHLYPEGKTNFTPKAGPGASKPLYEGQNCQGILVAETVEQAREFVNGHLQVLPLMTAYGWYPDKKNFFNPFFEKLAGTKLLRRQTEQRMSPEAIRASWKPGITAFKKVRKKYLLYKDFE